MKIYEPRPMEHAQQREDKASDTGLAAQVAFAAGTTLECGTPPAEFRRLVRNVLRRILGRRKKPQRDNFASKTSPD